MPLKFLNQFDDNQIIELINYIYEETLTHKVNRVQVFREPDRCDEFGNQSILVNAWDDVFSYRNVFYSRFYYEREFFFKCA